MKATAQVLTAPLPARRLALPTVALALPFVLIWTSAFPAAKIGLADSPPLIFLAARFLTAGALLLAWAALRGELRGLTVRDLATLALLGLLNHALYLGLSWTGMGTLSSGLTTIIISANPILVALFSAALLGERLSGRKLAGLALGFAGVVLIARNRLAGGSDPAEGLLLVTGALFTLALGTVLYKRLRVSVGLAANTGLQTFLAGALLLPLALATENPADVHLTAGFLAAFVWMVAVVSIGAYLLWFALLERGSASAASAWLFLAPPLGLAAGELLLGEQVGAADYLGILPVVLGIALVTRAR